MGRIDANILLQGRQSQMADPLDMQSKVMGLQVAKMQLDQARRDDEYNRTIGDLYKGSMGDNGQVDQQKLLTGVAQAGLGARIPGIQKQFADADKARADLGKTTAETGEIGQKTEAQKFKLMRDRQEATNGMLASVLARPNASHQDVISGVADIVRKGFASPEEGAAVIKSMPGRPEDLRDWLMGKAMEGLDASERMKALAPKFEKMDTGGAVQTGTVNPLTGQFTPGKSISKTASPEARMTDARERQLAAQGVSYQTDSDGNLVALPNKLAPGASARGQAVLDAQGRPMQGKSSLTEDQAKASGWLAQARNAYGNVLQALSANPEALKPGLGDAIGSIPLMGAAGRSLQGPERQKFNQAVSSMSEAFLRAATGAGVNKDEAAQKIAELTPQFGDSEAVVQQKMASIPVYLQSLETRAGPGAKKVASVNGPAQTSQPQFGEVPEDIAAILKKHGGK